MATARIEASAKLPVCGLSHKAPGRAVSEKNKLLWRQKPLPLSHKSDGFFSTAC